MPLLSLLLVATVAQESNLMAAKVTLERPRMTYAEFGAWVQNRIHVPITVSTPIRERKATVLVSNQPVGEIMKRFADTFFLEWERNGAGLKLRLISTVAGEEEAAQRGEEDARRTYYREMVDLITSMGKMSPDQLERRRAEIDQAAADLAANPQKAAAKPPTIDGFMFGRLAEDATALVAGEALSHLSKDQVEQILVGKRYFASSSGTAKVGEVSTRWLPKLADMMGGPPPVEAGSDGPTGPPANLRLILKGDPKLYRLFVRLGVQNAQGQDLMGISTILDSEDSWASQEEPKLAKRLRAWERSDVSMLSTKLRRRTLRLPRHATDDHPLSDLLDDLHQRTNLPIIADAFRTAADNGDGINGSTFGEWRKALQRNGYLTETSFHYRMEGGWLQMRTAEYWRQLLIEIPERLILPLEKSPSLDTLASLAAGLSPAQENRLEDSDLVMDVPGSSLRSNVAVLRLWSVLSSSEKKKALADELPLRMLNGAALQRAVECLDDTEIATDVSEAILPYLLPGGPSLPNDLTLSIEPSEDIQEFERPRFRAADASGPPDPQLRHYGGFKGTLASSAVMFRLYEIPLTIKP